uniref:Uncharacterized protein n=1 Tax=Anguilla anguilla TaxID=7936 RepID=A0A0E9R4A7_ANGAN
MGFIRLSLMQCNEEK